MKLCNSDWEFLSVSADSAVSLNDLFALVLVAKYENTPLEPTGVLEVYDIIRILGMDYFLQPSQMSILTMANKRQCDERRAEAIMLAVGATDWFKQRGTRVEDTLMLGLYPFPFVNEVREKVGSASFFTAAPKGRDFLKVLHAIDDYRQHQDHERQTKFQALGTLMPFGPGIDIAAFETEIYAITPEHPALQSWVIEPTGCVRISQVGLVASSDPALKSKLPWHSNLKCTILAPSAEGDKMRLQADDNSDLLDWVNLYSPQSANFAVCVRYSSYMSSGILFTAVQPGVVAKVGLYIEMKTPDYEMPETQNVDWVVL